MIGNHKVILSAIGGTILEYYDALLYTHLLFILTPLFFPSEDLFVSRVLGMGSYAIGFLMRPLGGIIFGHIGDRLGRKVALGYSIILMSLPTFIIGVLPTYATIGIAAPVILILCRLLQSFSVGGESAGATVFLVEHAKRGYESTTTSFINVACNAGGVIGAAFALIGLRSFFPEWGWRIPFLLGAIFGWVGYYIRRQIEETPEFTKELERQSIKSLPLKEILRSRKINVLRTMGICAGVMAPFQMIYVYIPDILRSKFNLPIEQVIAQNIKVMLIMMVTLPVMGYIADRIGFKKVIGWSLFILVLSIYPLFLFVSEAHTPQRILLIQSIISIISSGITAPCCVLISQFFSTGERYTGCAFGWSLGAILFAGCTPLLSVLLVEWNGNEHSPAYILIFCGLLGLLALKENYPKLVNKNIILSKKDEIGFIENI